MSEQFTGNLGTVNIITLEHESTLGDDQLRDLLEWSPAEFECTSRFRRLEAKTSWCLSRWLLRDKLFELFGIRDADRHLSYGKHGKPFISGCDIHFNWSHSDGCVALIIGIGAEVGIDIENVGSRICDYLDIAKSQFLACEHEWIGFETGQASWERFLSLFVQKEAWLKAIGEGLSRPLTDAPAALRLPPYFSAGRTIVEIGQRNRYILAGDASIGNMEPQFQFQYKNLPIMEWGPY
jgi:phosphopantetheinyl transferase